jgi:hypothetical protein
MINRLGGITADVDTDVLQPAGHGTSVVVVPRGNGQRLTGSQAVTYASYGARGDLVRLTRFQNVLNGILTRITSPQIFLSAMQGLGRAAQTTMSVQRMSTLIAGLAADALGNNVDYRILDVKRVDTGGAEIYTLDRPKVRAFVRQSLAASIPKGLLSGGNSVLVKNGVGTPELGRSTRDKLLRAGFSYVDGGNVPGFPYRARSSVVLIFSSSPAARDRGAKVAAALGLPSTDVRVSTLGQSVADVIVLLGRDYRH